MTAAVRHRLPTRPLWALAAIIILILMRLLGIQTPSSPVNDPATADHPTAPTTLPPQELPTAGELHRVRRAVDGDTLLLENGVRVRLIGVDTPETKHPDRPPQPYGAEAS